MVLDEPYSVRPQELRDIASHIMEVVTLRCVTGTALRQIGESDHGMGLPK